MLRLLAGLALLALSMPAFAEEAAAPGRFQLAPGEAGGFVRLDTRTGTVSHCGQREGVWRCDPLADPAADQRYDALFAEVARLSTAVNALSTRVDALAAVKVPAAAPQAAPAEPQPGFAASVLDRFLDLVRKLKHPAAQSS
jgi:hypothetical protein